MAPLAGVDRLLTPEQVAAHFDVPPSVVHRFVRSGLLDAFELAPGVLRVRAGDVARFLADHPWLCTVIR